MTGDAYLALARLEGAGVTLALDGNGNLRLKAAAEPPAALLAEAKRFKATLVELLRLRLAEPHRLSGEVQL